MNFSSSSHPLPSPAASGTRSPSTRWARVEVELHRSAFYGQRAKGDSAYVRDVSSRDASGL